MNLKMNRSAKFGACFGLLVLALATPATLPAATIYTSVLLGSNEVPPNGSTASGTIIVTLNGDMLTIAETFSGLTNVASGAHIHCCAPIGTNAIIAVPFTAFPAATSGTYNSSFDLTLAASYNGAFITANGGTTASAEAALIAALNAGLTYANIHDAPNFGGGEIRGQLQIAPEPSTAGLLLLGLIPAIVAIRKRAKG